MTSITECPQMQERLCDYAEGVLPAGEHAVLKGHLLCCQACREDLKRIRAMHGLLQGTLGEHPLNPEFTEETSRKLRAVTASLPPLETGAEAWEAPPPSFLETQAKRFGAVPWWALSGAFHALLLLLLTLIGMAILDAQKEDVVIMTNLEQKKEPEKIKQPLKRDVFRKPVPTESIEPVLNETPVVMHEEVEVAEAVETENDADAREAVGDEGISDVPLGGSGTVAALGLGGGGGGAFGRPTGAGGRLRRARRNGGGQATESAVEAALAWLARHQDEDGKWSCDKFNKHCPQRDVCSGPGMRRLDTASTGLALLAFLGAGYSSRIGKYKDNVRRATEWLVKAEKDDGDLRRTMTMQSPAYAQPMATMALVESYGMSRVKAWKKPAQKAVQFIADWQNPYKGWRYKPKDGDGDISVSGWMVMAAKSARIAGLRVPGEAYDGAHDFINSMSYKGGRDDYKSRFGYHQAAPTGRMYNATAIGMTALFFLGDNPADPRYDECARLLEKKLPAWGGKHFYYWYYGTIAMFSVGGKHWKQWNQALKQALLPHQRKGGHADGSWDNGNDAWMKDGMGGRVITTAIGALCLEVYYRYNLMLK